MDKPHNCADEIQAYYERTRSTFGKAWDKRNQLRVQLAEAKHTGASEKVIKDLEKAFKTQDRLALALGNTGD